MLQNLIFSIDIKFGANPFKMAELFQDGDRPPSWILVDVNFDGKSSSKSYVV